MTDLCCGKGDIGMFDRSPSLLPSRLRASPFDSVKWVSGGFFVILVSLGNSTPSKKSVENYGK